MCTPSQDRIMFTAVSRTTVSRRTMSHDVLEETGHITSFSLVQSSLKLMQECLRSEVRGTWLSTLESRMKQEGVKRLS